MSQQEVSQALGTGVVIEAIHSMTGAESIAPDHLGRECQEKVAHEAGLEHSAQ